MEITKKVDKTEELGKKICRVVGCYEGDKEQNPMALAALAETLFSIREIFRSYDERFKKSEENLKNKERR